MTPRQAYERLEERFDRVNRVRESLQVLGWDRATMMPDGGVEARKGQMSALERHARELVPSIQTFSSFSDTSQIKEGQLPSLYRMHETYKHAKNELQHLVEPMLNTIRNENNKLISFYLKEYDKKRTEGSFSATKVMQIYAKRVLIFSLIVWITLYFLSSLDSLFLRSEYFFYAFGVGVLTATLLFTILIFVEYFLHLLNRPNLYKEMRDITEIISELRAEQIEVDHIFRLQKWFLTLRN